MRYAIVSDLHANIHAWEAVYDDLCMQGVDEIICLGDVVGYGPHPLEVFESCYATVHHMIMGNHDAAVCGKMDLDLFHTDPRRILEWTRLQLHSTSREFLSALPLVVSGDRAFFTHACVNNPANFDYIYESQDCIPHWNACSEQLIFSGHTHLPMIHMVGHMGQPHSLPAQDIRISDDFRYFVNVGSVGQPRDGDPRSCYVIYDSDERYVSFRRVEFHLEGYFASLKAHKLSVHPSMLGNKTGRVVDFNPLNMPDIMGHSNTTVEENVAKELNERFEKLTDRREADTRVEPPSKPKKGKTLKATRAKNGGVSRTRAMAGPDSSRMGSTTRMRPKSRTDNTSTQKAPQPKSAAAPLLLIIGGIILVGVIVAIIMVLISR